MGEKRGNTGKLHYDFNTAANLEVELDGIWYRVTAREFRSFNNPRRISGESYSGPVYLFGTNQIIKTPIEQGISFENNEDPRTNLNKRENERS
jgi:hypothetical protein